MRSRANIETALSVALGLLLAAIVSASWLAVAKGLEHQEYGGAGGRPYVMRCPAGALVGLDVAYSAGLVGGIRLACDQPGTPVLVGTISDAAQPYRCPEGQRVVGIYGAWGSMVDRIGIVCTPVASPNGPMHFVPSTSSGGGMGFRDRCRTGHASGFDVRAGALLDAIRLICDEDG